MDWDTVFKDILWIPTHKINKGTLRETFFMNQLSNSYELFYPKVGDFLVIWIYLLTIFSALTILSFPLRSFLI